MREYPDPVNCPNCGKFMAWDSQLEEYTCSCKGYECIKSIDRPGWITIRKKDEPRIHEWRYFGRN